MSRVLGVLPLAAFSGALVAMAAVFLRACGGFATKPLVLTKVALHFVSSAVTNALIFNANDRGADAALCWRFGSFGDARWNVFT